MSFQIFNDPLLLDYLKACILMPQDEREHVEAMTGHPYDVDSIAVGNFMVQGPKWVAKDGDAVLSVGGFALERPGVWRDYMLTTPQAWEKKYAYQMTRLCRRAADFMFSSHQANRLELIAPLKRVEQRPELMTWYQHLRYEVEGVRRRYCADGSDAIALVRIA
jgi:hypothetical protein